MKVYPNKLQETFKKKLSRVYIVSGDEPLLVQESCDLVRRELAAQGFAERDLFHVETGFDWSSVLYSGNSMSLFAERKLIEVRLASGKPGDQGGKALTELVDQLSEDSVLLLVLPRLDASSQRTKWFKTLESQAVFVQIWPIDQKELPRWLEGRFRQAGLRVERDAIRLMAPRIEGNLLAAVQEIERLKLTITDREIVVADVEAGVADSARYDVFKLIDSALLGNAPRCVRMINGLRAEGAEPLFLVNMLSREIRNLETMKAAIAAGENQRDVFKKARVWDKRVPIVSKCLERHQVRELRSMQTALGCIDRTVKGIEIGDPWRLLDGVVLQLAGQKIFAEVS
jgi:DNA polymerase-3 subunit delta